MPQPFDAIGAVWDDSMPSECEALCALIYLDGAAKLRWSQLSPDQRRKLILAFRRAIELGARCSVAICQAAESPSRAPTIEEAAHLERARRSLQALL